MSLGDYVQWVYLKELTEKDKARLVDVDGQWMSTAQAPDHKFFIKKLDGKLVICEEYLDKKD